MKNLTYKVKRKVLKGPAQISSEYGHFIKQYNKGKVVKKLVEVTEERTLKTYEVTRPLEYYKATTNMTKAIEQLQAHFQGGRQVNVKVEDYQIPKIHTTKGNEILLEVRQETRDSQPIIIETWANKTKYKRAITIS